METVVKFLDQILDDITSASPNKSIPLDKVDVTFFIDLKEVEYEGCYMVGEDSLKILLKKK